MYWINDISQINADVPNAKISNPRNTISCRRIFLNNWYINVVLLLYRNTKYVLFFRNNKIISTLIYWMKTRQAINAIININLLFENPPKIIWPHQIYQYFLLQPEKPKEQCRWGVRNTVRATGGKEHCKLCMLDTEWPLLTPAMFACSHENKALTLYHG